ncbi:MAG: restriction endonuclease [Nitrosotalea sp.]
MSTGKGQSFEARIALLMANSGFVIKKQPHSVYLDGENIGDLDIIAEETNTKSLIGVSCKEWLTVTPGTTEFNQFVTMLKVEKIKYGVFASATGIASTVLPLLDFHQKDTGMHLMLLKYDDIKNLESYAHQQRSNEIESFFLNELSLSSGKTTLANIHRSTRKLGTGISLTCKNLIPINHWVEAPGHILNRDLVELTNAKLLLHPYWIIEYSYFLEVRKPGTGEVLNDDSGDGKFIIDGYTGRRLEEGDSIVQYIANIYHTVLSSDTIVEDDFTISKLEQKININAIISDFKTNLAAECEITGSYPDRNGELKEITRRLSPSQIKILQQNLIYLPSWELEYKARNKKFVKNYFAYDGKVVRDDFVECVQCRNIPSILCSKCLSLSCENHTLVCLKCNEILCIACGTKCASCKNAFCEKHIPSSECAKCEKPTCENCFTISCNECGISLCKIDNSKLRKFPCMVCKKNVCENCGKNCIDCNSGFCREHVTNTSCYTCHSLLCNDCAISHCHVCTVLLCKKDLIECPECGKNTCGRHNMSKKFGMVINKNFCSEECLKKFDNEYRSSGVWGKIKKVAGR